MNNEKVTEEQLEYMLNHAREKGNVHEVRRLKLIRRMNMAGYQVRHFVPIDMKR